MQNIRWKMTNLCLVPDTFRFLRIFQIEEKFQVEENIISFQSHQFHLHIR